MNENWRGTCNHVEVVVVVAGDGEVPHPAVVGSGDRAADDGGGGAVGGKEMLTLRQFVRCNPLVLIRVVEEVAGGGVDDLGAVGGLDLQVVEGGPRLSPSAQPDPRPRPRDHATTAPAETTNYISQSGLRLKGLTCNSSPDSSTLRPISINRSPAHIY
jgi:hypothetical protein